MSFNVEMPDGTLIEGIPDGTTKEQIHAKWKSMQVTETVSPKELYGLPDREKSFFNKATEAAATVLGSPVDLATAALNVPLKAVNLPQIEKPALGSEYLKSQIEQERLVPPGVRTQAGVFLTPQAKEKALRDYLGAGNYLKDQKGNITHVRDDSGKMVPYQEGLYDWTGAVTEAAGPVLATATTPYASSNPAGRAAQQGAGMGASSLLRHGFSALGGEEIPIGERAKDVMLKTLGATAGGYLFEKAGSGLDYLANMRNRSYGRAMESPVAKDRVQSFQRQGVPSSIAQDTGSPSHVSLEMSSAKSVHGQRTAQTLRNTQIDAIESRANRIMSDISKKSGTPEAVTAGISEVHKKAVGSMKGIRESNWNRQWNEINAVAKNKEVLVPENYVAELNAIKNEHSSPGTGQEAAGIVAEMNKRLSGMYRTVQPKKIDVQNIDISNIPSQEAKTVVRGVKAQDIKNILHDLSVGSYGTGKQIEQGQAGIDKALANRLRKAFEKDMENASSTVPVVKMIEDARSTYKVSSEKIKRLGNSVIGKLVNVEGKADVDAVTIAERLNTMRPPQVKALMKTLDVHDKSVTNQVRRYYLETALEKAHKLPSGTVSESRDFSEQAFLSSLPKGRTFDIVYNGTIKKQDVLDISNIVQRLQELKHAGTGKSLQQEVRDIGGTATGLLMGKAESAIFAVRSATDFITPKRTAEMMMTPEGKKAFLRLRGLNPGTPAYWNAITQLAIQYKKPGDEQTGD